MPKHRKIDVEIRNIRLSAKTYERLDRYKSKLIGERGTSNITFDDAVSKLLDWVEEGKKW